MDLVKSFTARGDKTVSMTPTTTTSNVQLLQTLIGIYGRGNIRVFNNTGGFVYILFGPDNTVAATSSHMPIPSGDVEVFGITPDTQWVAAILATGSATGKIYFTHGEGL